MPCCVRCKPCSPRSRSFTARSAPSKKSASIGSARRKAEADRLVANVQAKLRQQKASSLDVFAAVEGQVVELAPSPVKGSVRRNDATEWSVLHRRLLCPRRNRPRRRAAEQRDEL